MSGPASMIGSLHGEVVEVSDTLEELLIEVGGVGYRVVVAPATARSLAGAPEDPSAPMGRTRVRVHIHHVVREDAQTLYGFTTSDERRVFATLISAHGVGPALALAILSVHTPDELRVAVATGDIDSLCAVPGVGRKTAARLLVDLSSKLGDRSADSTPVGADGGGAPADVRIELREALVGLGYDPEEIRIALREVPPTGDPSELLRTALQRLATV
ncbi:MAG: Holliday junction branch migration protein RuvA [Actinomycetota bacterium]